LVIKTGDRMIRIDAIIRPERVNIVLESMAKAGCTGFTYSNVSGRGTQKGVEVFTGRGSSMTNRVSLPKVLVTAVVEKANQKKIVESIISAAKTSINGEIGDGKIFISEISDVIRVRTGDSGTDAL
jgi:nitrogen regulatory protein P-II 1|tara:strand:+ start:2045 stop:2422 length:378 start_codon:yes stop_codon:yes gene_type:complete